MNRLEGVLVEHELILRIPPVAVNARIDEMAGRFVKRNNGKNLAVVRALEGGRGFDHKFMTAVEKHGLVSARGSVGYRTMDGTISTGSAERYLDLDIDIHDKDVFVTEDIIDKAITMRAALEYLSTFGPNSLSVIALLWKDVKKEANIPMEDIGFKISNYFAIGEWLDWDGRGRDLDGVWEVVFPEK